MEKLKTRIEIRKTSEGKIECSGDKRSSGTTISTENTTTIVEFSGNHIKFSREDLGDISIKLKAHKSTPKIVFAGNGNRLTTPLKERGKDLDPSEQYLAGGIAINDDLAIVVFVPKPKVMGPEMRRRVKAYKKKRN